MAGIFGVHTGAWGTPDFGITEKIGDMFGRGRNTQGGSNIWGGGSASTTPNSQGGQQYSQPIGPVNQGQVLGSTTGGRSTPTSPNQPIQQPVQQNQNQSSQQPDLYNEIGSVFDDLLGSFGGQQSNLEGLVRTGADTQKAGINEQLGFGIQGLNQNRENVRTNQVNTLADLAQNMRDSAQNVGRFLGAKGAGNSSANDAASFALQKVFGKERAGVQRQGNDQLAEIDMNETNLKAKASEMLNGVETWANSQMSTIAQQFNELRNNIGQMKGNMRAQAIQTLYNQAEQVKQQKEQYAMAIQQQAQDRLAQLNNLKLELANSAQFDPEQMVFNEYGFDPRNQMSQTSEMMFNPLALARKKQNLQA